MLESMIYGVVPLETLKGIGGLAFLHGIIDGSFPRPPITELIGFMLSEAEQGRAVFTATPGRRHYNPLGSVHGGYAATLLDSCMGCAVHSVLAAGRGYTTLEFKVNFVRPMTEKTGPVRAEGRTIHVGNRSATAEGFLKDEAGRILAHATTTCLIFDL
jgi:uncharacterized protein (TIGR00369 family)